MTDFNTATEDDIKWAEGIAHLEKVTRIIILPEYDQWVGTDMWRAHLLEERHHFTDVPGCPACSQGHMMTAIHEAVFEGGKAQVCWELQDGYGVIGGMPGQHFDWSGVRDSSPAAIARMYAAVTA